MITNVNNLHINFERLVLVNFFPECAQTGEQKNNSLKLCSNFYTTHSKKKKCQKNAIPVEFPETENKNKLNRLKKKY